MFELKITANTVEELLKLAAAMGAVGSIPVSSSDVPLPEPRSQPEEERAKPKTRAKRVLPVTEAEQVALDEPEEAIPGRQTPQEVAEEAREAAELVLGPQPDAPAESEPEASSTSDITETSQEEPFGERTGQDGTAPNASPSEIEDLPAELQSLITATETVGSWAEVKEAMGTFQKGTLWPTLSPEQQNHIRASTWETLVDRAVLWLPDHHHDLSAFRLWVEAQDEPAEIRAALALLQADPNFQAKGETMKLTISASANDRISALGV